MSYEPIKEFEYRGFKCEIVQVFPEEAEDQPFYDFCIISFVKPTTLDKILFFAIGEGLKSDAVAALIDLIGLTAFYPGDFNKDIDNVMKIGMIRHEDHIACWTTDMEFEEGEGVPDHWKFMRPNEMEDMIRTNIDIYHDSRKRMIDAMKMYRNLALKMQEALEQIKQTQAPKV